MIRAPASPSFAVRRGCDPGELGLVALAQTKTKKSLTSPAAAESSEQRAGIVGASHLLLCHRDRSAIHQDAARNSVPFRRSVRVTSTSPRTAQERAAPAAERRRGDEEGAGRASTYTAIDDGRTAGRGGRRQSKSSLGRGKDRRRKTETDGEESIVLKERRAIEEAKPSTRTNTK